MRRELAAGRKTPAAAKLLAAAAAVVATAAATATATATVAALTALATLAAAAAPFALIVGAGPSAAATAVSAHRPLPTLVDSECVSPGQVRPATIILACGDGNALAKELSWRTWTGTHAAGRGDLVQNDCTPDCAGGRFHSYPARFALSDPVDAAGRAYFTKVTITFPGSRPQAVVKRVEVVTDCFVNPPQAYIPKCSA